MAGEVPVNDLVTLVLGTSAMLVMVAAIIGFAFLFQRKLIKKERAYRDIEKLLQKQELQAAYSLIQGQDAERKRIASDIHDNIGSLLATIKIYSDLAMAETDPQEAERLNNKINDLIKILSLEVRKIAHSLDTSTLNNFGLSVAIRQLCEAISNSGKIKVVHIIDIGKPIDGNASLHLYRIVQELFTNTLKHAQATAVRFEITQVNGEVTIIHEDNGVGFDTQTVPATSMGLQNIRSRITHLNGGLTMKSGPQGSTFIVEIPESRSNG